MAYVKTTWSDGQAPALSAANLNKIEQGIFDASATADTAKSVTDSIADFVVDEGTDGIWTYRKWDSGIAECWGVYSETKSNYNTALGGYGYYADINFPTGLFISAPIPQYSVGIGNGFALSGTIAQASLTKDSNRFYAVSNTSGTQSTTWYIYACGKWR